MISVIVRVTSNDASTTDCTSYTIPVVLLTESTSVINAPNDMLLCSMLLSLISDTVVLVVNPSTELVLSYWNHVLVRSPESDHLNHVLVACRNILDISVLIALADCSSSPVTSSARTSNLDVRSNVADREYVPSS